MNWFINEVFLVTSAWLFHNTEWSSRVWSDMVEYSIQEDNTYGYNCEEVHDFINRNNIWHRENNIGPSKIFTPEFIDKFTDEVVVDFKCLWKI